MRIRIILRAKNDFGKILKGELLILYNDVFDVMNGIAFYPIDRHQWDIIAYDRCTDVIDLNSKFIYENDIVARPNYKNLQIWFHDGCFLIGIKEHSDDYLGKYFAEKCAVIGNIHENKELL
jgi:hypothetical protein